eukprot:6188589-Pleurochrysis_carterae.AAC.2
MARLDEPDEQDLMNTVQIRTVVDAGHSFPAVLVHSVRNIFQPKKIIDTVMSDRERFILLTALKQVSRASPMSTRCLVSWLLFARSIISSAPDDPSISSDDED